jgi:hypothetical protein
MCNFEGADIGGYSLWLELIDIVMWEICEYSAPVGRLPPK